MPQPAILLLSPTKIENPGFVDSLGDRPLAYRVSQSSLTESIGLKVSAGSILRVEFQAKGRQVAKNCDVASRCVHRKEP